MNRLKYIYVIVPIENIDLIKFFQVFEKKESLRFNNDETLFIVKFIGNTPIDLISYNKYTSESLMMEINNPKNGWIKDFKL